jgi:hypothetical protein
MESPIPGLIPGAIEQANNGYLPSGLSEFRALILSN